MLRVVGCLTQAHDLGLVALALAVCVLATNATTRLLCPSGAGMGEQPRIRLGAAIMAFGTGVWTTHFISILAYLPGSRFGFDLPLVALSLSFATGAGSLAFLLAPPSPGESPRVAAVAPAGSLAAMIKLGADADPYPAPGWAAAARENRSHENRFWHRPTQASAGIRGVILAMGICMMHFAGMRGVRLPGTIRYQADLVMASFGLTVVFATVSMWLLARRKPGLASIFLMLAVVSTHFIAMGSITLDPFGPAMNSSPENSKLILAVATSAACILILALAVAATGLARYHDSSLAREARRFRILADATSEGLLFERGGRIHDVNRAMCKITESASAQLIGLRLGDIIPGFVLMPPSDEAAIEYLVMLPDGQTRPVEVLWRDDADHIGHVLAIRDLSRQKAAELLIDRLARFDSLTGLGNRDMFEQQLQKALALADRDVNGITLLHIGLNRLDDVYEALGPRAGEQVLIHASRRLSVLARDSDTLARIGRDEFAIIRAAEETKCDELLADRIVAEMSVAFSVDGQAIELSANLGLTKYPADGPTPASLIRNAALSLRQARIDGVGRWRCFEPSMDLHSRSKQSLEHDLRLALAAGQFSLNYQPFVEIEPQLLSGYEALLRWDHPERGRVPPSEFIPIAEEFELIGTIGDWVLATACAEAASWNDPVTISVNLSPKQFIRPGIVATVADVLRRTGLPAARLELEITEGTLMDDKHDPLHILNALKALGVKIAMDDFGTGYSSLSYLQKFPFDKIKIDRSFISDIEENAEAETIVRAIITLGRSLRLDVTAEGVETKYQLEMLRRHGCTFAQGYLLGRPHAADQLGQHIARDWRIFNNEPRSRLATSAEMPRI